MNVATELEWLVELCDTIVESEGGKLPSVNTVPVNLRKKIVSQAMVWADSNSAAATSIINRLGAL